MIGNKVLGEGPIPCSVMIVGEGPGKTEAEEGRPFCGVSGSELDWVYLKRAAKLRRQDVYVTNLVKWRTDEEDSDPTDDDLHRDEPELVAEIEAIAPSIIVAVGRIAARWFLQSADVDMERYHGTPVKCPRYPTKTLLTVYHPAAGLHQPERYYDKIFWDFEQLGRLVRGEIGIVTDRYTNKPDYSAGHIVTDGYVEAVALDTEGSIEAPWGMSASIQEGRGSVRRGPLGFYRLMFDHGGPNFAKWVKEQREQFVLHNALYDLPVLSKLGLTLDQSKVQDTMLMAYLLPWLPRGLKPLAFKLCGMEMESYEDVIRDAQERLANDYLTRALEARRCPTCKGDAVVKVPYKKNKDKFKKEKCPECKGDGTQWPAPTPQLVFDNDGTAKQYKPRSIGRSIRALLERGTDLKAGWDALPIEVRSAPEGELGGLREATLDDIPIDKAIHYSARDADATLRVYHVLEPLLKKEGLWNVYEIDKGIIPIIDRMHSNGILIDRPHFKFLDKTFTEQQRACGDALSAAAGHAINPSSPLQVAKLLYDTLGLKGRTRSTDEKTMETLKIKYKSSERVVKCIDLINDYRELNKLLGTYVKTLPLAADKHDRIHTRFLLHVTSSGRLSSRDPNLQNQPTRTERGRLIRAGFIAKPGCRLASVDLDQIELRVAAHLSGDENMIEVFRSGRDIHRATASLIYGKPMEEVSTQERMLSKTINFGILYGMSPKRLFRELSLLGINTTLDECVGYINDWFKAYPDVRGYMEQQRHCARNVHYVEDLFGRRRYVPGVYSTVDKVREESFRWATNHPIQATAAGILKLWLRRVWDNVLPAMAAHGFTEPLLTVHDEVIFEVQEELSELLISLVVQEAEQCMQLSVPIAAKGKSGMNWSELK